MIPVAVFVVLAVALFGWMIPAPTAADLPPVDDDKGFSPGVPLVLAPAPIVKTFPLLDQSVYGPDASGNPRGIRNNNPLNITTTGDSWEGMTGTDGKFLKFVSPEKGIRCATIVYKHTYFNKGLDTIRSIIEVYAPATDSNNVDAYCHAVAEALGIGEYDAMTFDLHVYRLLQAMGNVEQGKPLTHWYTQAQILDGYEQGRAALGLS